jgi:hypothetical protein
VRGSASLGRWAAVAAVLLAVAADARGEGLSLFLEPAFTMTSLDTRDQLGTRTSQESRTFTQNYRLNFDRDLGPALSLTAGGLFLDRQTSADVGAGWSTVDATARALYGRLTLSLPALTGGLTYDVGDARATASTRLVSETAAGFLSWRPLDLPEAGLRLSRTHLYDATGGTRDITTTSALVTARYQVDTVEAKYALLWAQPLDAVSGTEASSINQVAQAIYTDRLFQDRTTAYASLTLRNQTMRTLQVGTGTVSLQQHPVAGLSLLEVFPAQPTNDTLGLNPAIVDGNLTSGAALDIGYAPTLAGDTNWRDMGVQFGDLLTDVNTIRIWVDRLLTTQVAAAYAWSAYQSDDNRTWSPVAITGPVTFGPFENRFEIPIQQTRARYLKVVTRPLQAGVTTDPAFANVQVTELQAFLVTAASAVARDMASSSAQLDLSATTQLWRRVNLAWDLTGSLQRRISPDATIWNLLNGLTANQWLSADLQLVERLARHDSDYGIGHLGQTDWSAGLVWKPLLTFTGSLIYSGRYVDSTPTLDPLLGGYVVGPGGFTNSLASLARADLYQGISAQLNTSGSFQNQPDGKQTWTGTNNITASLIPNPWSALSFGWYTNFSTAWDPDGSRTRSTNNRLDGSVTIRPTSAISVVGSISRIISEVRPTTTGTAQVYWSPLRGDLQLSAGYSKTFDTATQSDLELFTPSLRWNVRQGVQLTGAYTLLNTRLPVSESQSRSLSFVLSINL